jgi:hypothetical protein
MSNKKDENSKKAETENEVIIPSNENSDAVAKEEIDKIKSEVNQLSDNLQTTVTELKRSIVDIRSAVSEIENPFNLLRTISSEKDMKKLNGERLPQGVKSLMLGNHQENGSAGNGNKETAEAKNVDQQPSPEPKTRTPSKNETNEETLKTETQPKSRSKPTKINSSYLDWVWDLLDVGLKAVDVHQLACSCEFLSYLPAQTSQFLYSLAVAAETLREKGLTKAHLLLNLYRAAVISKANVDWEDMEGLIAVTEEELKKVKPAKGAA